MTEDLTDIPEAKSLVDTIKRSIRTSDNIGIDRCIQCGVCTSSCPATRFTDYNPREVVKRVIENDHSIIKDDIIWSCFYCYSCNMRCPRNNSPSQVVQVLKQLAIKDSIGLDKIEVLFEYADTFAEQGISKIPDPYVDQMEEDFGKFWLEFRDNLDSMRRNLGLGDIGVKDGGRNEIHQILEGVRFYDRLEKLKRDADKMSSQKDRK
ncbi:heterodisulfide reductase subunit HdrC [Methanosalsum zhilinae DSM 4017]|uniref:Heterodisulfide reductase subunit HdrC n=1 Tax=Methanosalsum zhilinae (strain DSM 4017 / NBRC 107636 / OCM 62 / WeN5) TaxID=679901 RepID=F7XKJ0_METZD|nr:ferredoxin:CoB-CoM heterodisulfide reductase subunit HdrC [Methanosalsum zhilinae]AEH60593.1 heterodisulfide reductase subunit HdrC [Methanosalsum zhilinae DSM 4017]